MFQQSNTFLGHFASVTAAVIQGRNNSSQYSADSKERLELKRMARKLVNKFRRRNKVSVSEIAALKEIQERLYMHSSMSIEHDNTLVMQPTVHIDKVSDRGSHLRNLSSNSPHHHGSPKMSRLEIHKMPTSGVVGGLMQVVEELPGALEETSRWRAGLTLAVIP